MFPSLYPLISDPFPLFSQAFSPLNPSEIVVYWPNAAKTNVKRSPWGPFRYPLPGNRHSQKTHTKGKNHVTNVSRDLPHTTKYLTISASSNFIKSVKTDTEEKPLKKVGIEPSTKIKRHIHREITTQLLPVTTVTQKETRIHI